MDKPPDRFKINATGFQAVNCKSYMEFHETNNSIDFIKILVHFRILNMENKKGKKYLNNAINNENLTDIRIKDIISRKNLNLKDFINKVNDKLYTNKSKQKSLKKVEKLCNKEDIENPRKIAYQKRRLILENFNKKEIKDIMYKEKRINLVLDNYRVHHAVIVENICNILNINLIFLKPYCPDLNPIEDVWRVIKSNIYKSKYCNLNELKEIFKTSFYKTIDTISFYKNWLKTFMNICI